MQNLPVQEEISECRAGLGEFGMLVEFVRNTGEGVQLGGDFCLAKHLQQMLAVLRRDGHIRQTVENQSGRVASFDMSDGAGVTYRGLVAARRHERLCNILYVSLRIERETSGQVGVSPAGSK